MADQHGQTTMDLSNLTQGALADIEKLVGQHLDLLRAEVKQELAQARNAAVSLTAGAGAGAVGGLLGAMGVVHLLHRLTGLPLWACYLGVAGGLGALGTSLIKTGVDQASQVSLVPRQTANALKEDLSGLRS